MDILSCSMGSVSSDGEHPGTHTISHSDDDSAEDRFCDETVDIPVKELQKDRSHGRFSVYSSQEQKTFSKDANEKRPSETSSNEPVGKSCEAIQAHRREELASLNSEAAVLQLGHSESHQQADELLIITRRMELEILELEKEIQLKEKCLERLQSLHDVQTKNELWNSFLAFYSDWDVVECEDNNKITLSLKNSFRHSKLCNDAELKGEKMGYKMRLRVDQKTFAVEDVQLEPKDTPIDDIVQAMVLSRTMHSSGYTLEPHNDLEFLLRNVGQRILLTKKP